MAQDRVRQTIRERVLPSPTSYYALLGLHPSASPIEIRRAYRELSKRYHPDTTDLPAATATAKFQQLNEAYATLSNPERRMVYDQTIGYSRLHVIQPPSNLNTPVNQPRRTYSSSAYLDPTDRPLSAGEIFALFILALTFVGCLLLAIAIGLTRGESAFQVSEPSSSSLPKRQQLRPHQPKAPAAVESRLLSAVPLAIADAPKIPELNMLKNINP
ncbi:MAG TPA: molecular chaperone DnaJ [Cyanobacteria bacterium UBA8553]|nr:molecular chaperone DnaJ [Cyanobacteria bacterium UBA8553]HAJ59483.1 molecular chaperone DnaJ [Cyanobacteria bacterium UBA8543]